MVMRRKLESSLSVEHLWSAGLAMFMKTQRTLITGIIPVMEWESFMIRIVKTRMILVQFQ